MGAGFAKVRAVRAGLVCAVAAGLQGLPASAVAQLHGDANVQGGIAKRFLSGGDLDGSLGGLLEVELDVELLPSVLAGAYVDYELAPTGEPATPAIISFGVLAKKTFAVPSNARLRWWALVGGGYAIVNAPSYSQSLSLPNPATGAIQSEDATVHSAGGGFFEIPFGVGGGWRPPGPVEWIAQASGRIGAGFSGSYYDPNGRTGTSTATHQSVGLTRAGEDTFGLFLTVGAAFGF